MQLKVYQEDFETERREKKKLTEEKQSERLRLQAEITSLQLQLDRCRSELTHYSNEATRLSQQLHLKLQKDQEKYKSYLESKVNTKFISQNLSRGMHVDVLCKLKCI